MPGVALKHTYPTSDVATFAGLAIYIWHIFATKRDILSQ